MKKWIVILVVLGVVAGVVFVVSSGGLGVSAGDGTNAAGADIPPVISPREVIAEGKVIPTRYSALSMPVSGIVDEILVSERDQVRAGQMLVYLQNGRERAATAEAEAALESAQAHLNELLAGSRTEEIAASEAALETAQAELNQLREPPRPEELAAAEAELEGTQAELQDLNDGPDDDELSRALADRANAQSALQKAQFAYDQVKWDAGIQARPESLELQQATNEYEAANARYQKIAKGASDAEIATARAKVREAQAKLDRIKSPARANEIAAAEARVRRAQADLDLIKVGARPEAITKAEADVKAAQAALERARVALRETELRAPFSGVIAALDARVGEPVDPSRPLARLADIATWQIETDDLTEIEVVDVTEGAKAAITFDAIPDLTLTGTVVSIKPYGEEKQGDMTYTVLIRPDEYDARLRWNMTAMVKIEPTSSAEEDQGPAATSEMTGTLPGGQQ